MPQTLTLGSTAPDVTLLQTTLNNRPPTALPPLLVDSYFGNVTLQRVKEFQTNNGLLADGLVGPVTWGKLLPPNPPQKQTFYTKGRYLYDRLGNKVILRGVNKMSVWDEDADLAGRISFPEIRKTGANTVRIVWAIRKDLQPGISDTEIAHLDALITTAKANHLIPTIELHDGTGAWNRLQDLVNYWIQPAVVKIVKKHQAYLLVNNVSMCSQDGEIDYLTVIEVCHQNEIGWYAWEWGPGNDFNDPQCDVMDMTPDRLFAHLKPGWAKEVATSSPHSIKNTSVTPPTM